ncbi:type VII secretion-associated serine protease mycosin [Staphylococcus chromogenes]|nr:type VII secretion-associated serine protease mycosin [Staphylococcus chromogenes]
MPRTRMHIWALAGAILLGHLWVPDTALAQEATRCLAAHPAPDLPIPTPDRPRNLEAVHHIATGAGIRVAVIDTGVANHPRLGGVEAGHDFVDNTNPHHDCDGHGTIVAGIIAARPGPDPLVGVAPDATIISIKQTSAQSRKRVQENTQAGGTLASVAAAINRAVDLNAHVINLSVVSCLPAHARGRVNTADLDRALQRAEANGSVVVAAAGNVGDTCEPDSLVFPAHSPTVIAVTASADTHHIADYSVASPREKVSAPGHVDVALSPRDAGLTSGLAGPQGPAPFVGTSFAAPYVAGIVALLKQRYPLETPAQLRARIFAAATPGTGHIDPSWALAQLPARDAVAHPVSVKIPGKPSQLTEHRSQVVLASLLVGAVAGTALLSVARAYRRPTVNPQHQ